MIERGPDQAVTEIWFDLEPHQDFPQHNVPINNNKDVEWDENILSSSYC